MNMTKKIAGELSINEAQVKATMALLDEGATVPFIARYRKEATGGLSDTQLRDLTERLHYLRELQQRRETILQSIESQGKLTVVLKQQIEEADNKSRLEDLYLPYKPKRRTKAEIAKEAGLLPLAEKLLADPTAVPETEAQQYLNPEHQITSTEQALEGARQILMERFVEEAELISSLREYYWQHATFKSQVIKDQEAAASKFSDYFDYQELIHKVPSHRALAVLRGQKEKFLRVNVDLDNQAHIDHCLSLIEKKFAIADQNRPGDAWLLGCVDWAWKIKLKLKFEVELIGRLREKADAEAIVVFKNNLKNLLMAAPAGAKVTMGLDPGFRTGVKLVIVDDTGKLLHHEAIYPHPPQQKWQQSLHTLDQLIKRFHVTLISIGNGTASRETDALVSEWLSKNSQSQVDKIVVSEAGASVYSASAEAAKEFPDLDVSFRGAVSIARRVQDPLAELVKIEPKAIGVGQYQHDVNQSRLTQSLIAVIEDCVNAVGADINTASVPLLSRLSGLSETLARNIVEFREQHGRFKNREQIKQVPRMGEKTYQQAVGFLRIINGDNPLDASAVHPEAYPLVDQIASSCQQNCQQIIGNAALIESIQPAQYVNEQFGLPTVIDVLQELKKPGRDPRPEFKTANFSAAINKISDLKAGMTLEGVVSNVANFGAFVDIGVHQDGLVHISEMANHFVDDPATVVKVGQIVQVTVMEVDQARKRIKLTMREKKPVKESKKPRQKTSQPPVGDFAERLSKAWKSD